MIVSIAQIIEQHFSQNSIETLLNEGTNCSIALVQVVQSFNMYDIEKKRTNEMWKKKSKGYC
jgi:hypothetical protein